MNKKILSTLTKNKGFTLIELLVVVAVVGILAAAVVSGINPTKRFQEARDSQRKQIIGTVATALESCYTKNSGSYTPCDTFAELQTADYVKLNYGSYVIPNSGTSGDFAISATGGIGCISAKLEAPVTSTTPYWKYTSDTGYAQEGAAACS